MTVTVETGARLHFGFRTISPEHERLFGSLGVALDEPRVAVSAEPADSIDCEHELAAEYADRAASLLSVDGARVTVDSHLSRHVGLGSGTQLALATLTAIACAHDLEPAVRERAPALGRGRRSGIGVATFESGGFVVDAGRPTESVLSRDPTDPGANTAGEWTVPETVGRWDVPDSWRFVLVRPTGEAGRSGRAEAKSIREAMKRADPEIAERIESAIQSFLLPGLEENRIDVFGRGLSTIDLLNGSWFRPAQGAVYRPAVASIIDTLGRSPAVFGHGQSSWGPAVYGLTNAAAVGEARSAGRRALEEASLEGTVSVLEPRNRGVMIDGNIPSIKY
ncbi:MAG: beta-ribofuranosylaminobenzene 5'-phosphate synthase family protein [Halodesulfurarchaeum sp.]